MKRIRDMVKNVTKNMIKYIVSLISEVFYKISGRHIDDMVIEQFVKYAVTGFVAFVAEYGTFYLLNHVAKVWYIWSNSVAMTLGVAISFFMNRYWSFKSKGNFIRQFVSYGILYLINLAISKGLMALLIDTVNIKPLISKLIVIGILICWNFIIYRKVIFNNK